MAWDGPSPDPWPPEWMPNDGAAHYSKSKAREYGCRSISTSQTVNLPPKFPSGLLVWVSRRLDSPG